MRIEPIALEHHGNSTSAWRHLVDGFAIDEDVTRSLLLEPGDDAKQGRLAAPGRAEQHQEFAIARGKRDTVYRGDRSEFFSNCVCRDRSHVDLPCSWPCPWHVPGCSRPSLGRPSMAADTWTGIRTDGASAAASPFDQERLAHFS